MCVGIYVSFKFHMETSLIKIVDKQLSEMVKYAILGILLKNCPVEKQVPRVCSVFIVCSPINILLSDKSTHVKQISCVLCTFSAIHAHTFPLIIFPPPTFDSNDDDVSPSSNILHAPPMPNRIHVEFDKYFAKFLNVLINILCRSGVMSSQHQQMGRAI